MELNICVYDKCRQKDVIAFLCDSFKEDGRIFDITQKESDMQDIETNYMQTGCFWCLLDSKNTIQGTIAIRQIESDCWEIRRFFIRKKYQNKGYGTKMLKTVLYYAIQHNIKVLKGAVLERSTTIQHLHNKLGFVPTARYNNSSADIFYKVELTSDYRYKLLLEKLNEQFQQTLILNPTENIPIKPHSLNTFFLEGLYVSERPKGIDDKVIFGGRNEYIDFQEKIKNEWRNVLRAYDVDLKTLSGLHAHLILFLCILQPKDKVMLLPEICGGHFSTENILRNLGAEIIHMEPDCRNHCVDQEKTRSLINQHKPKYIFVDRSEGLIYEDFSWLACFKDCFKIFDASQYLSQIIAKQYLHPFEMGFDMLLSTLHKNYPGPQKGLLCVSQNSAIWQQYIKESKTYISNTHPEDIATSIIPLLDTEKFKEYVHLNKKCNELLRQELIKLGLPVIKPHGNAPHTMHIWILCKDMHISYDYYLKLEQLGLLANYRLLPYNLGYGLRIGTSAAVRTGLKEKHIPILANIMARAYYENITPELKENAKRLIRQIKLL